VRADPGVVSTPCPLCERAVSGSQISLCIQILGIEGQDIVGAVAHARPVRRRDRLVGFSEQTLDPLVDPLAQHARSLSLLKLSGFR